MSKMTQHQHKAIIQAVTLAAAVLLAPKFASGKTLFLAHYDETVDADFAVGTAAARPVKGYQRAGIVTAGHWGGAVDLTDSNRTCTYPALKNLNPRRGTVDFRFAIDEDRSTPLFEGADAAVAYATGMAAITATLMAAGSEHVNP